ncbi:hypothetical protein [Streptosporangium sp. CA-115845]|uniref:hypothetical protein n=1 Tax=Streptosporangium sp. CA-115845 TaxID=3240071 RepID=UPI003D8C7FBA
MVAPNKLTLVPYLQRWDHNARVLSIRLLVAPTGNPLKPLISVPPGVPAFADASFAFSVSISGTVGALPQRTLVDQTIVLPDGGTPLFHAQDARTIFTAIKGLLEIPDTPAADTFAAQSRDMTRQLRKYLPKTYRQAFAFVRPRTSLAVTDDSYQCLMRCPPDPTPPPPPTVIGWGEALAFSMRHPRLAEALGLIHTLDLPFGATSPLVDGGWLWVDLAPAGDYFGQTGQPDFTRSFATRVPALPDTAARPVFTPVVFPVSTDAAGAATLGNFDKVFVETIRFDDGFSKIVHARQPLSADPLDEDGTGAPIGRDEGIQLGWDDEDILEGQNRALGAPPEGEDPVLAPRGVFGYRVDVRPQGAGAWTSLSKVDAPLSIGVDLGVATEERWSEVVPAEHSGQTWLSAWFVNWRGGSLVLSTEDDQRLMNTPPGRRVAGTPVDADVVELRYGRKYDFRVRLTDTTGGGPALEEEPSRPGEAPVATLHMRRHRTPGIVEIDKVTVGADGTTPSIRLWRPPLGYPEAVFAAGASARAALLAQITANDAGLPKDAKPPVIRDPDTAYLHVRVLIKVPTFDPSADADGFVTWYETSRAFPANPDQALDLALSWVDASDYRELDITPQLGADGTVTGPVTLPTARDVRLEVRAAGRADLAYFATEKARLGRTHEIDFHAVASAAAEADALVDLPPADAIRSVFLRPDLIGVRAEPRPVAVQNVTSPALLGRLASAADLVANGPQLMGREGERVAFGCAGLTHHLAPDGSSVELAEPNELAEQWICVVRATLDRDWTWRGGGSPTVTVVRTLSLPDAAGAATEIRTVGTIELMNTVNTQATAGPERAATHFIFLDAFPPPMGPDGLPYEVAVTYRLQLALEGGGEVTRTQENLVPIVTRPTQVPRVVAAGIALTPYNRDSDYASTGSRTKRLWLEFHEPLTDPRDAYFARPLAQTPDPMLLPGVEPVADPEVVEGPPLDPELVRVITPGQPQDLAGLSTMQRLEPAANSDRHFLLPLPPNTDPLSPELFSFFTYDLRVGHDAGPAANPLWCTAQGRFGEPLVLDGVQHPVPELACAVVPEQGGGIRVQAPFASCYVGLRRVVPSPPNTEIWVVLYGRVVQADGSTKRNIQIALNRGRPLRERPGRTVPLTVQAEVRWSADEVKAALDLAGLPGDTPITALAVELLPEPNGNFGDPLGGDLGQVRVLRTSPLVSVESDCCTP